MQIPDTFKQFLDQEALIIVAGKEHGIIYELKDGMIEPIKHVADHPPSYSDDEGFFFRSAGGQALGSGAPKEYDESVYLKQFEKHAAQELDALVSKNDPRLLYIFEPEHLKGRIEQHLQNHPQLTIHNVRYGNYTDESPLTLIKYIDEFITEHKVTRDTDTDFERDLEQSS